MKILNKSKILKQNQYTAKNLLQEVFILKKLDHPCIVKLLDLYENKKKFNLIFE